VSARTLRLAVGHVPGTALPGEDGNVVLAGHRDTFFRPLKDVEPGDAVTLTTPEGRFEYRVEAAEVVAPTRTDLLESTSAPTLTLVTCYPFYLVGSAPDRFIVRATRNR
jgi:sortase A